MKLTRYLLRATRNGSYGDSMERVMLNTVLGALPLQADGRSFYYADYNVAAKRIYSVHRWPCCSGTLPQVVADYGINTYLREPGAVWVNLYQPSQVRWTERGTEIQLEQTGSYPEEDVVRIRLKLSRPMGFVLRLRVPAWSAGNAGVTINGRPVTIGIERGFASIERVWRTGDSLELKLHMALRLEPLPANGGPAHTQTVAMMWGQLVLFALRDPDERSVLKFASADLLTAQRTGPLKWVVTAAGRARSFIPFTEIGDAEYSTYLLLA